MDLFRLDFLRERNDVLDRRLDAGQERAVGPGGAGAYYGEVVRESRGGDAHVEVYVSVVRPVFFQTHPLPIHEIKRRLERDVKPRRAHQHIKVVVLSIAGLDSGGRYLGDRRGYGRDVGGYEGFEVAVAGGDASTAGRPGGDYELFQFFVARAHAAVHFGCYDGAEGAA